MSKDLEEIIYNDYFKGCDKTEIYQLIQQLSLKSYTNYHQFTKELHLLSRGKSKIPSKALLSTCYQELKKNGTMARNHNLEKFIKHKVVRSQSGVLIVTLVMRPDKFSCPFNCHMCPDERIDNGATVDMPRSYLSTEPAEMRAMEVDFDTIKQFRSRLITLEKNGHEPDKVEIIVLGGTFSTYPRSYQQEFIRDIYYAANTYFNYSLNRDKLTIEEEQTINETSNCHIVGITLETRPDQINKAEIMRFRRYGCTRVQLGVQHTNNHILDIVNRKHYVEDSIKAIQLLKEYGYKVDIHIMPDLPGSNPELDKLMMDQIFKTPLFQPDYLKIYPCLDVQYTEIRKWKQDGRWKPYAELNNGRQLKDVIIYAKKLIPRWMRVNRVQRDFPPSNVNNNFVGFDSKTIKTNLRQEVLKELEQQGLSCQCIRCREIKNIDSNVNQAILHIDKYEASNGMEYFISYNTPDMKYLYGFIRLRFNNNHHIDFLKNKALIRELHVYGNVESVNKKTPDKIQHIGFGKKLISKAELIAWNHGYKEMAIISAVGTRDYYRKMGYYLKDTYMMKQLTDPYANYKQSIIILLVTVFSIILSVLLLPNY